MRWLLRLDSASLSVLALVVAGCGGRTDEDDRAATPHRDGSINRSDAGGAEPGDGGGSVWNDGLNDLCINALPLDLATGAHIVLGDTAVGSDEYPALDCGSMHVAGGGMKAPQLYYRFAIEPDATYRVTLEPSFYGFVYVFDAALGCDFESIQSACSSQGASGDISPIVNPGTTATFAFELGFSGSAVLAVDSDTSAGPFELHIQRL